VRPSNEIGVLEKEARERGAEVAHVDVC
jgi:hypothetical protein